MQRHGECCRIKAAESNVDRLPGSAAPVVPQGAAEELQEDAAAKEAAEHQRDARLELLRHFFPMLPLAAAH